MHKAITNALRPTTRREAIKAGTAFAAMATVGIPAAQAFEADPLETLETEYLALDKQACDLHDRIEEHELSRKTPFVEWTDHAGKRTGLVYQNNIDCIAGELKARASSIHPDSELSAAMDAFVGRLQAEFDKQTADIQVERERCGLTAREKRLEALYKRVDEISLQLRDTPSQSLRGASVKMRMAAYYDWDECGLTFASAALADLERLSA